MEEPERSDTDPRGEESPYKSPEEVASKAGDHEMPTLGRAGDGTEDAESLVRRPATDEDEVDGDAGEGGTPPGTAARGS